MQIIGKIITVDQGKKGKTRQNKYCKLRNKTQVERPKKEKYPNNKEM